jgi:hypothetical protein
MVQFLTSILLLCMVSLAQSDPRIPAEVRFKSGDMNPVPKPLDFSSAMPWGIALADTRVRGYENATIK